MNSRQGCLLLLSALFSVLFLSGCASGRKQKLEQREKLAASSGLYCDFVNGEKNHEVELELNLVMSKRCDTDRPFTITNYKTPSEVTGVLYCCAIKKNESRSSAAVAPAKAQLPVDKKPGQPQDNKSNPKNDLEGEIEAP